MNTALTLLAALTLASSPCFAQDRAPTWTDERQRNIGIFLFDDVEIIDFTGPYSVFLNANAGGWHAYRVFTVAESTEPITTVGGMTVLPDHAFGEHPGIDILVVPGGWGVWAQRKSPRVLDWIRGTSRDSEIVFSVCTGSFVLSRAGLLDGQSATTNAGAVARLQDEVPTCRVLGGERFVDSGKVITSAGLSAGIDGALHVVERTIGKAWAQMVSFGLEYDWRPDGGYSALKLAGRLVPPPAALPATGIPGIWKPVSFAGTTDRWESIAEVRSEQTDTAIHDAMAALLIEHLRWERRETDVKEPGVRSAWTFADPQGGTWAGELRVTPGDAKPGTRTVRLEIGRATSRGDR